MADLPSTFLSVAPNGTTIAYTTNESDLEHRDLVVFDMASATTRTLLHQEAVARIVWSADSQTLLVALLHYSSKSGYKFALLKLPVDGSHRTMLHVGEGFQTGLAWYGNTILFSTRRDNVETYYVLDGSELRAIYSTVPCFICDDPRFTPDGQFFLLMQYPDLYIAPVACLADDCTAELQPLTDFSAEYNAIDVAYARYGRPAYDIASDGSFLVYTFGYRQGQVDIGQMPLAVGGWQQRTILYSDRLLWMAHIAPDDQTLFFTRDSAQGPQMMRVKVDGSQVQAMGTGFVLGFLPVQVQSP